MIILKELKREERETERECVCEKEERGEEKRRMRERKGLSEICLRLL